MSAQYCVILQMYMKMYQKTITTPPKVVTESGVQLWCSQEVKWGQLKMAS